MKTDYDIELLSCIEKIGGIESIKTHEQTQDIIEGIETMFVMGYSGIDWGQNKIIFSQRLGTDLNDYLQDAGAFLTKIGESYPHLLDEIIFVIGDGLTNLSYEMTFSYFLSISDKFLVIPQHTYIWFKGSKKCIHFSFENEAHFG
jgi:chromosome condensin MukBEF complex kleisin-like MukF subunit